MSKKKRGKVNKEMEVERYREQRMGFREQPSKRSKSKRARVRKSSFKKPSKPKVSRTTKKEIEKKDDYSDKYNKIKSQLTRLGSRCGGLSLFCVPRRERRPDRAARSGRLPIAQVRSRPSRRCRYTMPKGQRGARRPHVRSPL